MVAADDAPIDVDVDPLAPAGIAYTSGTTGYPKGAVHSQYNLLMPGAALVASRGYGPSFRRGDSLPLTILNMQVLTTLMTAQAGGCSVIMDRIDALGVAEWIREERVTAWNGPPAVIHSMAQHGRDRAERSRVAHRGVGRRCRLSRNRSATRSRTSSGCRCSPRTG